VNDHAAAIMEVPAEKIANWSPGDYAKLIHPDDLAFVMEQGRKKQAGEKDAVVNYNWRMVTPGGNVKWIDMWSRTIPFRGRFADMLTLLDITERKQAEEALIESEEMYRLLAINATDVIWTSDFEDNFTYISPSVEKLRGYTVKEVMARPMKDSLTDESYLNAQRELMAFLDNLELGKEYKTSLTIELEQPCKDGSTVWVETAISVINDNDGTPVGLLGVTRNITERKQAEEALRESEERWLSLITNTNDIIQILDIEGNILFMNKVYPPHTLEDIIGKPVFDFMDEKSKQITREAIERLLEEKTPQDLEIVIVLPGHGNAFFEVKYVPILSDGEVHRIISHVADISARKQTEEALRESEERFRALVENAFAGLIIFDADGSITYESPANVQIIGYDAGEGLGVNIFSKIHPDDYPRLAENFARILNEPDNTVSATYRISHSDGTWHVLDTLGSNHIDNPHIQGIVVNFRDITERKKAEEELAKYREHLEELVNERAKELEQVHEQLLRQERLSTLGEFSGSISHELRNPLGVIDSSVYFLKHKLKDADEKTTEHLDRIKSSVKISASIIESILNLTRMKEPYLEKINLSELLTETISASEIPHTIKVVSDFGGQDITINADSEQLRMAFKNIIKNAIDAMEGEGTLIVTARTNNGNAEISFADTGPGITAENMGKVFQPLFSSKAKGIGFGLSIVSMIAEKHGGTVEAKSEEGKGAEIIMELPLAEE
jgi:PAS domain S-box-containing protein